MAYDWIEMIENGIKPCPFCGGVAKLNHNREADGNVTYKTARVVCTSCYASSLKVIIDGYYGETTTEDDAVNAWNRRYRR